MRKMRTIAAFDIDGTVFRSSLLLELVEQFIEEGVFPARTRNAYERALLRWLDRRGGYEVYVEKVVTVFARQLRGVKFSVGQRAAEKVIREKQNRLYRYTRDLVKRLKKRGYVLIAVSHSPKFVVGPFGRKLGFHKVYGSIYGTDARGRFTGKVDYEDMISDKAAILRFAMKKYHAPFKGSIGVGDTESDIPMLRLVETPIAFNPNWKLYRYAKRHGWKVVVERKDVIYEK